MNLLSFTKSMLVQARSGLAFFLCWLAVAGIAWPCTTAVVSGSATADGRPILWKNRDTKNTKNEVVLITDGKHKTLAVVNAGSRSSIWMGVNEAGLCIENSVTRDLSGPSGVSGPGNGGFMLLALKTCATVEEVKQLLEKSDVTGRSTNANFGVIDAHGGAALFEASRNAHVMFDANDPDTAPHGMVIRSNFSLTGQKFETLPTAEQLEGIYSGERYLRATELLTAIDADRRDPRYVLRNCGRDMAGPDCVAYCGTVNGEPGELPAFINTKNTISRTTTVSYAVFQGVRPGEDPLLTTMWLGLGDPKFTVAVPCWVAVDAVAEELQGKKEGGAIGQAAIQLREQFYSGEQDGVRTDGLQEIWNELWAFEDRLYTTTQQQLEQWRKAGINRQAMTAQHLSACEQTLATLREQLKTVTQPAASQ
jgi:hypothetical protein